MLTYSLIKQPGSPLYESLYRCIRADILSGKLEPGRKLPSKRALASHLKISVITVEGAYDQLLDEGYIRTQPRVGYFVERTERRLLPVTQTPPPDARQWQVDLVTNASNGFPFSVWSSLQRQVMLDLRETLLLPMDNQGIWDLRKAIADHLASFRGLQVSPHNILVGAGTDFLYNLLIQLLGREKCYGLEDPGYQKTGRIYAAAGARCLWVPMDAKGVVPQGLDACQVLHISPSHHFPTGVVTSFERRLQLMEWVNSGDDRWIIEDDYDSEFRFNAHPLPTMASMDTGGKVIYMNTFSKTLAPSIRVSYMVLPPDLMERFRGTLGFYSCTVPSFEQHTLARFLAEGHFEKHLNRMRKAYKTLRNALVTVLRESKLAPVLTIEEQDAGLHFLLRVDTELSEEALAARCAGLRIHVLPLSSYYHGPVPEENLRCLVVNYSGLGSEQVRLLAEKMESF